MTPQEIKAERYTRITISYNTKLRELVEWYYDNQSQIPDENQELLNELSKQWKKLVYKANSLNKGLNLLPDAFEKTIARNHLIIVILGKESRLSGEFLNTLNDSLLQELIENDEQLKAFTEEYIRQVEEHKATQLKQNLRKV